MRHVISTLFVLWFLSLTSLSLTQEISCPNLPKVEVVSDDPKSVVEICLAAEKAIHFLANYNLSPKRKISIEIIDGKINCTGYDAYGCYDSRSDRIQLMSYTAILEGEAHPLMYGEPFDWVHYRGAIAHEVAHAVVQHNLKIEPISSGPQEYLAHSTQLASIPTIRRKAIITAMDIAPWESGDAISDLYMAIEPGKFAVKSYLHLTNMSDPTSFVELLLNAKWYYIYVP